MVSLERLPSNSTEVAYGESFSNRVSADKLNDGRFYRALLRLGGDAAKYSEVPVFVQDLPEYGELAVMLSVYPPDESFVIAKVPSPITPDGVLRPYSNEIQEGYLIPDVENKESL